MSAKKLNGESSITVQARQEKMTVSTNHVRIHKNGIEFRAAKPISLWTEMTIDLCSLDRRKLHCSGVIVACSGNAHTGYNVSMLFTHISKQAQTTLDRLCSSPLN